MSLDPLRVALWRFEQIAPVLDYSLTQKERSMLIDKMAGRPVLWPSGQEREIGRSTFYYWIKRYRADPRIESLLPVARVAVPNTDPVIKPDWLQFALALLEEAPSRSLYQLQRLIQVKFSLDNAPARSSLHRALISQPRYRLVRKIDPVKRRTRFVAANVHQIWQGDAKADFIVKFIDGTSRRFRILSLLDDCSRFILSARVVDSESLQATIATFHDAVTRFGLPHSFYADRGSPYDSYLFRQGLAILGVRRINTKPRNPSAHGKIEAYHRSIERWFVKELPHQPVRDKQHLQQLLDAMIAVLYHQHVHRELKKTPAEVFNNTISDRAVSLQRLHEAFLERHTLKPERKTGNVRLKGTLFRVPSEHLSFGKKLQFAVDLLNPEITYLIDNSGKFIRLEQAIRTTSVSKSATESLDEPLGSLSPLLETYRGRTLQRPVAGFGLPEIYQSLTTALGRTVPHTEQEAALIAQWLCRFGPFQPQAFTTTLKEVINRIGKGRPLASVLDEMKKKSTSKGGV